MNNKNHKTIYTDILIAGAGFAGSITALCLHKCGFDVCLVEKSSHPRFAIGESSTPIADMVLRDLSDRYDLPWLQDFSRYGSWQENYPGIVSGLKRGFSYYKHERGEPFATNQDHTNELLVAASSSNENSDTNWLRSDFDSFLVKKVIGNGIPYFDNTEIASGSRSDKWTFQAKRKGTRLTFSSDFYIDATGSPALLGKMLGVKSSGEDFLTNSRAIYSHFEGVSRWSKKLDELEIPLADYPYDPDDSTLHHLTEEGWIWMIRFNNARTSVGIMLDQNRPAGGGNMPPEKEWRSIISSYPSIQSLMESARLSPDPGGLVRTNRLQRRVSQATGEGWVALPHTIGFVDPLHSTGIAHTLTGIEKVVGTLAAEWNNEEQLQSELTSYEKDVFAELELIDRLIAGCYQVRTDFELFHIWSMLYFTAAIGYEQKRLNGAPPARFLMAGDPGIKKIVRGCYKDLQRLAALDTPSKNKIREFRERVEKRIEPYNEAGLLDPDAKNMYAHTAAE